MKNGRKRVPLDERAKARKYTKVVKGAFTDMLNKAPVWKHSVRPTKMVESCHDGGPIAHWLCPWCKNESYAPYAGSFRRHWCISCMKSVLLDEPGVVVRRRIDHTIRKTIRGMSSAHTKHVQYVKPCNRAKLDSKRAQC